ncbi:hypothetical protein [Mesorhizobium sp. A556]
MAKEWTLKSLIDAGVAVQAYCHASSCHHNQKLNLELLMDHFGPDFPAMATDLEPKLRCSKCGGKKIGLIFTPDRDSIGGFRLVEKNLYQKAKGG